MESSEDVPGTPLKRNADMTCFGVLRRHQRRAQNHKQTDNGGRKCCVMGLMYSVSLWRGYEFHLAPGAYATSAMPRQAHPAILIFARFLGFRIVTFQTRVINWIPGGFWPN